MITRAANNNQILCTSTKDTKHHQPKAKQARLNGPNRPTKAQCAKVAMPEVIRASIATTIIIINNCQAIHIRDNSSNCINHKHSQVITMELALVQTDTVASRNKVRLSMNSLAELHHPTSDHNTCSSTNEMRMSPDSNQIV